MILQHALIISLTVLFIHACTWDGMILSWLRILYPIDEDTMVSKPLYNCPICMSPYWGTAMYLVLWGTPAWRDYLATIGAASGLSVLSVIAIKVKDYCISRTRKDDCC